MSAHSKIGASSMHRWANCPGSVKLCEGIPNTSSSYAEEGTRAHELAAKILNWEYYTFEGVPDDMREAVLAYTTLIKNEWDDIEDDMFPLNKIFIEHKFDLSSVYPNLFGTADCVIYHHKNKLLTVYDYKHGAGIPVEVEENEQLLYYALGAYLTTKCDVREIELVIVQPRCDHPGGGIRRWRLDLNRLLEFKDELILAAHHTTLPGARLEAGDWCRFCPASAICPKLHSNAMDMAKKEFSPVSSYDEKELGKTLTWLPILESWIKNVKSFAYNESVRGRVPHGFKLVPKRASRSWIDKDVAGAKLKSMGLDEDEIFNQTLKSPAQIEKLLLKDQKFILEDLVNKESRGTTLVPSKDQRDALSNSFTVITEDDEETPLPSKHTGALPWDQL